MGKWAIAGAESICWRDGRDSIEAFTTLSITKEGNVESPLYKEPAKASPFHGGE